MPRNDRFDDLEPSLSVQIESNEAARSNHSADKFYISSNYKKNAPRESFLSKKLNSWCTRVISFLARHHSCCIPFFFLIILILCFASLYFLPDPTLSGFDRASKEFLFPRTLKRNQFMRSEIIEEDLDLSIIQETAVTELPNFVNSHANVSNEVNEKRRMKIVEMMQHAWKGYVKFAMGENEVRPVTKRGHSPGIFGKNTKLGATIVDALDTLYIMNLTDEYKRARDWIVNNLSFRNLKSEISVFETNIRFVGGLLSAYSLTRDKALLDKVVSIVDEILPAFNTPTGIPFALWHIANKKGRNWGWASGGCSVLAEFGTLHLEFAYLSNITGNNIYLDKVVKIRDKLQSMSRPNGLYPNYLNPKTGKWGQASSSAGALGDSFYEYLLKSWLWSGKSDSVSKQMFDDAWAGVDRMLIQHGTAGVSPHTESFTYLAQYRKGKIMHQMDHLSCFSSGLYALAAQNELGNDERKKNYWQRAKDIVKTCHYTYDITKTKLGPEAFYFNSKDSSHNGRPIKNSEKAYYLRPETIEAYFIMWRLTKDPMYREWAWSAAEAIEKYCKVEAGYSGIKNVDVTPVIYDDVQQSFFLAETLKYLYLTFSDDSLLPLEQWVFNTEAHPIPIYGTRAFSNATAGAP